jgi:hypothetical protein
MQGAMTQATEQLFGYIETWEERKDQGPQPNVRP